MNISAVHCADIELVKERRERESLFFGDKVEPGIGAHTNQSSIWEANNVQRVAESTRKLFDYTRRRSMKKKYMRATLIEWNLGHTENERKTFFHGKSMSIAMSNNRAEVGAVCCVSTLSSFFLEESKISVMNGQRNESAVVV